MEGLYPKLNHLGRLPEYRKVWKTVYGVDNCYQWLDSTYGFDQDTDGGTLTRWTDKITQTVWTATANAPVLRASDVSFNNYPSANFNVPNKSLRQLNRKGFYNCYDGGTTIAIVYRYIASGTPSGSYLRNTILGDGDFSDVRWYGDTINWGSKSASATVNFPGVGMFRGVSMHRYYSAATYDTLAHILVISGANIIDNGAAMTITSVGLTEYNPAIYNYIGGPQNYSGQFRIAEVVGWFKTLTSAECITLSDTINQKYALY